MKLTPKAAQSLRRQIKTALKTEGFEGSFGDVDTVWSFVEGDGIELKTSDGDSINKKMLMEILGGSIEREPAEAVEADAVEDEEKMGDEEEVAKTFTRRESTSSTKAADLNRVNAEARNAGISAPFFGNSARKSYDRKANHGFGAKHSVKFSSADAAEHFGAVVRLTATKGMPYSQRRNDLDIIGKTQTSGTDSAGGFTFNPEFLPELTNLRNEFGLARRLGRVRNMSNDTFSEPNVTAYQTVYKPGEGVAITDSDATFAQIQLIAGKYATLTKISNELLNDSALNIADEVAQISMQSLAAAEDYQFFGGDGTSGTPDFDVLGIRAALAAVGSNPEDAQGVKLASGNLWNEVTRADIDGLMGLLPTRFHANAAFVCHPYFYFDVLVPLMSTSNGATQIEVEGELQYSYRGKPVYFDESGGMPSAEANDSMPLLFGDFDQGTRIGVVNGGMTVAQSEDRYFDEDVVAVRVTERRDIEVGFGVGTETAAGPLCSLILQDA